VTGIVALGSSGRKRRGFMDRLRCIRFVSVTRLIESFHAAPWRSVAGAASEMGQNGTPRERRS